MATLDAAGDGGDDLVSYFDDDDGAVVGSCRSHRC